MIDISDFDGDGIVCRFKADVSGPNPLVIIEVDCDTLKAVIALSPPDLGEFAAAVADAQKKILGLWMKR